MEIGESFEIIIIPVMNCIAAESAWRIPLLKDLLLIRSNPNVLEGFNYNEIDVIIDDICKN